MRRRRRGRISTIKASESSLPSAVAASERKDVRREVSEVRGYKRERERERERYQIALIFRLFEIEILRVFSARCKNGHSIFSKFQKYFQKCIQFFFELFNAIWHIETFCMVRRILYISIIAEGEGRYSWEAYFYMYF